MVKDLTREGALRPRRLYISKTTHSLGNPQFMGQKSQAPAQLAEWKRKGPSFWSSSLLLYRGFMECPSLWLKFWAVTPDIRRLRTKSIMSSTWLFILENTYLLCPLENRLHTPKPTDVIPHFSMNRSHENHCICNCPIHHGAPTQRVAPLPTKST